MYRKTFERKIDTSTLLFEANNFPGENCQILKLGMFGTFLGQMQMKGGSAGWQRAKSVMADHIQSLSLADGEYKGKLLTTYNTNTPNY